MTPLSSAGMRAEPLSADGSDVGRRALGTARNRLLTVGMVFAMAFVVMVGRLVDLTAFGEGDTRTSAAYEPKNDMRGQILDRNGNILASSVRFRALVANPQEVLDPVESAAKIRTVLPQLDQAKLTQRLSGNGKFAYVYRNLTPDETIEINKLGIPGLSFVEEYRRFYPVGRSVAHAVGLTDIDGNGVAGVEESFNTALAAGQSVRLSIDTRLQSVVREELSTAIAEFKAIGGAGLVIDVRTGEVLAMVSLPDFDPSTLDDAVPDARFNRVTKGVYEMGSTFKLFTVAMALDSGTATLSSGYDASRPIHVARFTISDYKPKNRWLSVPEIIIYSSNIGAAHMALDVGGTLQREYLSRFGLMSPASLEVPEIGRPLKPNPWGDLSTMTVGFGHGIAVTPLQLATGIIPLVNGGLARPATLVAQGDPSTAGEKRVIAAETSRKIRGLMRLNVQKGTATRADVPGYRVGGKTGTAEKQVAGGYRKDARLSSFVGAFPMDDPQYVVLAMVDEPKGNAQTHNYATGGWVAAPVVGRIVSRMAPLLGIAPATGEEAPPIWQAPGTAPQKPTLVAKKPGTSNGHGRQLAAN